MVFKYISLFNTSSAGSITGMMPAPIALGPAPKFAPAVIGSSGRPVGAVNGVNVPGAVRGRCRTGDGTDVGGVVPLVRLLVSVVALNVDRTVDCLP
jgi:hypothetical protein